MGKQDITTGTYNGVGDMGGRVDYKSDAWSRWTNMMQRCYNKKGT